MKDDYISKLKYIAIISVICAHTNSVSTNIKMINIMSSVLNSFGIVGVPIFYMMSGYFFQKKEYKNFKDMIKEKFKIIIPWIIIGTLVYLYVALRKEGVSLINWMRFILGYNSYLYYLTNLILYMVLFYFVKEEKTKYIFISLFFFSIVNNSYSIIELPLYLNPFNFIIYFVIGINIQKYKKLEKLKLFTSEYKLTFGFIWIILFCVYYKFEVSISYFNVESLILNLFAILFVFGISSKLNFGVKIGENSFGLYLYHMPIAGIISYIFNKIEVLNYFIFIRPILTLLITTVLIFIITKIFKLLKKDQNLLKLGIRI